MMDILKNNPIFYGIITLLCLLALIWVICCSTTIPTAHQNPPLHAGPWMPQKCLIASGGSEMSLI